MAEVLKSTTLSCSDHHETQHRGGGGYGHGSAHGSGDSHEESSSKGGSDFNEGGATPAAVGMGGATVAGSGSSKPFPSPSLVYVHDPNHQNKTSSASRHTPNTIFQILGFLARSAWGDRQVPLGSKVVGAENERPRLVEDILCDPSCSTPCFAAGTVLVGSPSKDETAAQIRTPRSKKPFPEELLGTFANWDDFLK